MFWRLSARLVTGPFAFVVAGAIDLMGFAWARARARRRHHAGPR
ncbi:MAG: hypothetical protein ACR2GZ_08935 [Solirubrobacteraceae bacterium]